MGGHIFIYLFINKMNLVAGVTPHKPAALGMAATMWGKVYAV